MRAPLREMLLLILQEIDEIDAYSELNGFVLWSVLVALLHSALNFNCA